jgi:hypothetical protein
MGAPSTVIMGGGWGCGLLREGGCNSCDGEL